MSTNSTNSTNSNPNPTVQVSGDKVQELAKKIKLAEDEEVASYKPQLILPETEFDKANPTDVDNSEKKNFDQKIYYFPESYNALRKELVEHWPEIWPLVAWTMAFDGPAFVETMNTGLEVKVQFDTHKVDAICSFYLNELRKKRGLQPI